jgi:hypothetical protein
LVLSAFTDGFSPGFFSLLFGAVLPWSGCHLVL